MAAKHRKNSEVRESDEDATTKPERLSSQDSTKFIAWLRPPFLQENNEWSLY
jgi:hypothetical protein